MGRPPVRRRELSAVCLSRGLDESSPPFCVSASKHFLKKPLSGWEGLLSQLFLTVNRKGLGCQPERTAPKRAGGKELGGKPAGACPASPSRPGRPLSGWVLAPGRPRAGALPPKAGRGLPLLLFPWMLGSLLKLPPIGVLWSL